MFHEQAPPRFVTPFTSSTQPHQILEPVDSTGQQAQSSITSQGRNALQVETDIPGDVGGKMQVLNQSCLILEQRLGPDGDLLISPLYQVHSAAVPITMQPAAAVIEEAITVSIK